MQSNFTKIIIGHKFYYTESTRFATEYCDKNFVFIIQANSTKLF